MESPWAAGSADVGGGRSGGVAEAGVLAGLGPHHPPGVVPVWADTSSAAVKTPA